MINKDMTIMEALEQNRASATVFAGYGMGCPPVERSRIIIVPHFFPILIVAFTALLAPGEEVALIILIRRMLAICSDPTQPLPATWAEPEEFLKPRPRIM